MTVKLGDGGQSRLATAADSRSAIVAALATIPGVSATPDMPDVPVAGAAWPVWVQDTPDGFLALPARAAYEIWLLLPAGLSSATVMAADPLRGQLWAALWRICAIEYSEPVTVRFDNQTTMPGIHLRVRMRGQNNDSNGG